MRCKDKIKVLVMTPMLLVFVAGAVNAAHPGPQPRPGPSIQILSEDGMTTTVITPEGHFPPSDPFEDPPGTNHLENINSNMLDGNGLEMPNTLPSTSDNPYNLHPDPVVTEIDETSPTDTLKHIFKMLHADLEESGSIDMEPLQMAIDILEGTTQGRPYDGFPLLHYNGPNKFKAVEPVCAEHNPCQAGDTVVGGNVRIHQIWYDSHIESDTFCVDPSAVLDVPWTITYTIDTLNKGHDDFAPMVMYFDDPGSFKLPNGGPVPHVAMDQTFFPMEEGTRTIFEIGMAPGKHFNLTYHWGWRIHPPRVQVAENCRKMPAGKSIPQWEIDVFGEDPMGSETARLAAIDMIGDLAPAKRMWTAFNKMKHLGARGGRSTRQFVQLLDEAERAFFQWQDRTQLPDGFEQDPESTVTMVYLNNTLYGHMTSLPAGSDNQSEFVEWTNRGQEFRLKLYNGDYYPHGYTNVDFGGSRGWENQFQSTIDIGGAGHWFTFGRFHWWVNAGGPLAKLKVDAPPEDWVPGGIIVPPANRVMARKGPLKEDHMLYPRGKLGEHNVHIIYNFDPSRRLRIYQFDPLHHDVAIWSIH
jgi:hypothetical protein